MMNLPSSAVRMYTSSTVVSSTELIGSKRRRARLGTWAIYLAHAILLALFSAYVTAYFLEMLHDEYLLPQMNLMFFSEERKAQEVTYYQRYCDKNDTTAKTAEELTIRPTFTATDAMEHNVRHGVSIFPQVLTNETANSLRKFVLDNKNTKKLPGIFVIAPKHRFSAVFTIDQDPSVLQAAKEVATHPVLRPALDEILGNNAAVIEFSVISASYGAATQEWHSDTDVEASALKYARSFAPSYSLFIPLQDTTSAMGATELCPGSHVCHWDNPVCFTGRGSMQVSDGSSQDLWPKGAGALMNQQMQHRGSGHFDEHGAERVVVVISFAPRPRVGPGELETRMVSLGSTFSIKYDHWGHTLDDYADASTMMGQPWRTLRALGIYKLQNSSWGWDLLTMICMRLVNEAYGYYRHQLDDFIDDGGFLFLPKNLHGEVTEEDGWYDYLLDTFLRCKRRLRWLNALALGSFIGCCILFDVLSRLIRRTKLPRGFTTMRSLGRLLVSHGLAVLIAHRLWQSVCDSSWAANITSGKLYNLPSASSDDQVLGTLPYHPDVLVETRYSSRHLGAYKHMLDITHPGNQNFHGIIQRSSAGYSTLSKSLQRELGTNIIAWQEAKGGRLLTQNDYGNWYELSRDRALDLCHKELSKASSSIVAGVMNEIDFLLSETRFGSLRDSEMHLRHIPLLLRDLHDQLLHRQQFTLAPGVDRLLPSVNSLLFALRVEKRELERQHLDDLSDELRKMRDSMHTVTKHATRNISPLQTEPLASRMSEARRAMNTVSPRKRNERLSRTSSSWSRRERREEPYLGAWLKEGDTVEAKYEGKYEWYRARVISADADTATYDVQHFDGEVDEGLRRMWLRPDYGPGVGEVLEVRYGSTKYHRAVVVHVNEDGTSTVKVNDNGALLKRVQDRDIRRFDYIYEVGSQVEVCLVDRDSNEYDDDDSWLSARVLKEKAGRYDVAFNGYSSGVQRDVSPTRVRPLQP